MITRTQRTFARLSGGLLALFLSSTLVACGAAAPSNVSYESGGVAAPAAPMPEAARDAITTDGDSKVANAPGQQAAPRMIVRTANLTLVVTDVMKESEAIAQIAKDYNGFIVTSGTNKFDTFTRGNVTLRVESDKLDQALARLRALAVEVRAETITGEDVTAEFVDLDAQLKNLESAEAQLKKIMEQADETEDVLNVFNQLTQIRGQIDQIKGRMKFLSQSAALATINVELIPDAASQPVEPPAWRPGGTLNTAIETLIRSLQGLVDFVIFFAIAVLPILLIVLAPIVLVIALIRRAARKRKLAGVATTPAAATEPTAKP